MKLKDVFRTIIFLCSTVFFFSIQGCVDKNENPGTADVTFVLKHNVDDQELQLDQLNYTNPFGRAYKVTKLRYYISDFKFNKSDGTSFETDMYQYVNLGTPSTLEFKIEKVPQGDYQSISFFFGLDEEKNVQNGLPATLENLNMQWPTQLGGGYHYMQMEGFYDDLGSSNNVPFNTHMGIKNVNDSTFVHNYITITLPNSGLTLNDKNMSVELAMNINEWYKNPNDYDFPQFGADIMTKPEAQQVIKENGVDLFSVVSKTEL